MSIAVCENPEDQLFYLLSDCEGPADTLELNEGLNDLTGQLLIKVFNTNTIPIPGLISGIYILKAKVNSRLFQTKFLKE